jgi:hypothetical protein
MRHNLPATPAVSPPDSADASPGVDDMLRNASKLARLATELLEASAAALEAVMALAQQGIEESSVATASLGMLLRRLEAGDPEPGAKPVSAAERDTASATARRVMLRSGETVVRMRMLIDGETVSQRYRWGEGRHGATMAQLHAGLDDLAEGTANTAAGWPAVSAEIKAIERGIYAMREVARQHRAVADQAMRTVLKLQAQAIQFVRLVDIG